MTADCGGRSDYGKYPALFVENVTAVITQIKGETAWAGSDGAINQEKLWSDMNTSADMTVAEVNKISLAYSTSPKPECADAEKIFERLTKTMFAVLSNLYKIHNAPIGAMLIRHWHSAILQLLTALLQYGQSIVLGQEDRINKETGNVWEVAASVKSAPTSCRGCLILQLRQVYQLVADAFSELCEVKESSSQPADFIEDVPTEQDLSVLTAGIGLVKAAKLLHQKTMKAIAALPDPIGQSPTVGFVADCDRIADIISHSSERVDDFSASLYPPIDRDEVKANLPLLVSHLETLLQTFSSSQLCDGPETSWLLVIEHGITHNRDKVLQVLS